MAKLVIDDYSAFTLLRIALAATDTARSLEQGRRTMDEVKSEAIKEIGTFAMPKNGDSTIGRLNRLYIWKDTSDKIFKVVDEAVRKAEAEEAREARS